MIQSDLKGNIQFKKSVATWQAAIQLAAQPLVTKKIITPAYVEAIIQNVNENGNYFILLPEIAMPHARPEFGSLKDGLSFLKLAEPVFFPGQVPVTIFFVIAAATDDGHLEMIASLGELLSDHKVTEQLKHVTDATELLALVADY